MKYYILILLGFAFSLVLTPAARSVAVRIGAIDRPGPRRIHQSPTPRLGGPAILQALILALIVSAIVQPFIATSLWAEMRRLVALTIGATMVTIVGAIDDVTPLRPFTKLSVEIAAASIVVYGGYRIDSLCGIHIQLLSFPLGVLFIVTVVNAVNMVDGLDGLAAGLCLIITVTLLLLCLTSRQIGAAILLAALCGALLGFLPYNFHPARIFLGDSGALLLGLLLGASAISTAHKMAGAVAIAAPFLALGLPLAELMLTTLRRILRAVHVVRLDEGTRRYDFLFIGRPALFSADRDHIHHRLLALGIGHRSVVLLLYCVSIVTCGFAFAIAGRKDASGRPLLALLVIGGVIGARWLGYNELRPLRSGLLLPLFESGRTERKAVHVLLDLGFVVVSYTLAFLIQYQADPPYLHLFFVSLAAIAAAQMVSFATTGLYRRSYRHARVDDVVAILKALALATAAGWIATMGFPFPRPHPGLIILDAYLLATLVLGARISFCLLDHFFEGVRPDARRVLIYGAGRTGAAALHQISTNATLRMKVIGFLDDDPRRSGGLLHGITIHKPDRLEKMIQAEALDLVVLASANLKSDRTQSVTQRCAEAGLEVVRFEIIWSDVALNGQPTVRPSAASSTGMRIRSASLHV